MRLRSIFLTLFPAALFADTVANTTNAVSQTVNTVANTAANPNVTKAIEFLERIGEKLGATGKYLFAAYAKYIMASAISNIIGWCTFGGALLYLSHRLNKASKHALSSYQSNVGCATELPGSSHEYWTYTIFMYISLIVGFVIVAGAFGSNIGDLLAPEGAVVKEILNGLK